MLKKLSKKQSDQRSHHVRLIYNSIMVSKKRNRAVSFFVHNLQRCNGLSKMLLSVEIAFAAVRQEVRPYVSVR